MSQSKKLFRKDIYFIVTSEWPLELRKWLLSLGPSAYHARRTLSGDEDDGIISVSGGKWHSHGLVPDNKTRLTLEEVFACSPLGERVKAVAPSGMVVEVSKYLADQLKWEVVDGI